MGGKFFAKDGINPCSRIPTEDMPLLIDKVLHMFSGFFYKMEPVTCIDLLPKKDHGDLDFVCLVSEQHGKSQRDVMREYLIERGFQFGHNGPMEHIALPFTVPDKDDILVQIDLIFAGSQRRFDTLKYFYSRPIVWNSVIGQFARSLGYIFSTNGFFLLIKDARKQNRKILLTKDLEASYDILKLKDIKDEEIFASPESFCDWIRSSDRFDSDFFKKSHNVNSHRDARRNPWCDKVYEILDGCGQKTNIPVHFVDFSKGEEIDLDEAMQYEIDTLGPEVVHDMIEQLEKINKVKLPVLSGDVLIQLGYPEGKIIGQILQEVAKNFTVDDPEEDKISFVKERFPNSITSKVGVKY